jgi:NAD(P)-dependent dehydrogenase (short-subunit alcohol dehydrogenase family)
MRDFEGRTAVITGAASGIGLGIARALAKRGVNIALLDIEQSALDTAAEEVAALGVACHAQRVDVTNRDALYDAANAVMDRFGRLDIAVNNAGVAFNSVPLHETPDEMIDWTINVNLFGVLNGIKAFVPKIIAGGQGGHVVNTSSIGGFQVRKSPIMYQGLYAATKFGVTALSEGLRHDLEEHGIGVTILAPSAVATNIGTSDRNRQDRFGGATSGAQLAALDQALREQGMAPDVVGECLACGIENDAEYVFTHQEGLALVTERHRRIEAAFAAD